MSLFKKAVLLCLIIHHFGSGLRAQLPRLDWVKKIGGTSYSGGTSITLDKDKNVYTLGYFAGTVDFDPGSGVYNLTYSGSQDIFISKLDVSGNFIWAKRIGEATGDYSACIVTDTIGNVYISGQFGGTMDADPGPGVFNLTSNGGADLFILKLDAAGNFVWAKQFGGSLNDLSSYITLDASGNVYVAGLFSATVDFDFSASVFNLSEWGSGDIFVLKLDATGNFVWAKQLGGGQADLPTSISVDRYGNIYTTGFFYGSADFDPGPAYYALNSAGIGDAFISKLDPNGHFKWAKKVGGSRMDYPYSLKVDSAANVYISGSFGAVVDFDPGPGVYNLTAGYQEDIFILKLDSAGSFSWAAAMGGSSVDYGYALQLDKSDNVYVTGSFRDTVDFDPGPGVQKLIAATPFGFSDDIFVLKLDVSGNFIWVRQVGSLFATEIARSIALDDLGSVYTTGNFSGTSDFDPGPGVVTFSSLGGNSSAFIHKMTLAPESVGFEEPESPRNIYLYPNPANASVTIQSNTLLQKVEVLSLTGQVIVSETISGTQHQLDLTSIANGVYFVNIYSADQKIVRKKLVVQR